MSVMTWFRVQGCHDRVEGLRSVMTWFRVWGPSLTAIVYDCRVDLTT